MISGDWYDAPTPQLDDLRMAARKAVFAHNSCPPERRGGMVPELAALFLSVGQDCLIETPFHTAYGRNTVLGDGVFFNAGVAILDRARVTIGDRCMLGPDVQIYCTDHHRDPAKRRAGIERALPVTLGEVVWISGGAILLPGVTIGAGAIVGAGAVVTKDVPAMGCVVGNPAHPV